MSVAAGSSRFRSEYLPLTAIFAVALAYGLLVFNRGFSAVDEGHCLLLVELFRKRFLPYRDFYFQHTPLSFWFQAMLFQLFGPALIVNRIYTLVLFLILLLLFCAISRHLAAPPYRAIPPVIFIGFSLGFARWSNYAIDSVAVDFLTLGALMRFCRTRRLAWLFTAGLLAGICFCIHQNSGGAAAFTTLFAATLLVKDRGRNAPWLGLLGSLAAGLIAPLLVLIVFARDGLALEFLQAAFLAGATKSWVWRQIPRLILPALALFGLYLGFLVLAVRKILRMPTRPAGGWLAGLALFHLAALAGILAVRAGPLALAAASGLAPFGLAALALYALRSDRGLDPGQRRAVLLSAVFIVWMMVFGILSGFDFGHNLLYGVWSLVLVGYLAERLVGAVPESWRSKTRWALAGGTVTLLLSGVALSLNNPNHALAEEPLYQQTLPLNLSRARGIRVSPLLKEEAEGIVGTVQRETRPEDPILVFPLGGIYYFLSDRQSGTYWTFLFFENFSRQDQPLLIEQIERAKIPLVIVTDPEGSLGSLLDIREIQQVYGYILDHYQPGERYGRYRIYRRKS